MTRIVALDTSAEFGSIALVENDLVVEEVPLHSPEGFAHVLMPQLEKLMRRHRWRYDSVTAYAAGSGPGSFTGVRIGLAAVKGLAEACGARAAAVSNLKAMASYGTAELRAPFSDARRGEVYGGLYDAELRPKCAETVSKLAVWRALLPPNVEFLTPAPELFGIAATVTPRALAGAIARLAADHMVDPVALDANYVRRSDAELKWIDR